MGICTCTGRSILGLLGLLFWVAAFILWVSAGFVIGTYNHYDQLNDAKYTLIPAIGFVIIGVVFFFAGITGCCNLCKQNSCLLCMFGSFLLLLLVMLVGVCVMAVAYQSPIEQSVHNDTLRLVSLYKGDNSSAIDTQIDWIQKKLDCCGGDNYTDWLNPNIAEAWTQNHTDMVPWSCCKGDNCGGEIAISTGSKKWINQSGCYVKVYDALSDSLRYIAAAAGALALLLLVGFLCSCGLMWVKRTEETPYFSLN